MFKLPKHPLLDQGHGFLMIGRGEQAAVALHRHARRGTAQERYRANGNATRSSAQGSKIDAPEARTSFTFRVTK